MRCSAPYRATISRPARAGLRHGEDRFLGELPDFLQGLKPVVNGIHTARLKPCPDTKRTAAIIDQPRPGKGFYGENSLRRHGVNWQHRGMRSLGSLGISPAGSDARNAAQLRRSGLLRAGPFDSFAKSAQSLRAGSTEGRLILLSLPLRGPEGPLFHQRSLQGLSPSQQDPYGCAEDNVLFRAIFTAKDIAIRWIFAYVKESVSGGLRAAQQTAISNQRSAIGRARAPGS